jgi:hypothetical protein
MEHTEGPTQEQILSSLGVVGYETREHGKLSTYGYYKCRCKLCKDVWNLDGRARYLERKKVGTLRKQDRSGHIRKGLQEHREVIAKAKDVPCMDCKNRFSSVCMDFDHVRGKKSFTIAGVMHYKLERLVAEIAKCDVVCANCHRLRTASRRMSLLTSEGNV